MPLAALKIDFGNSVDETAGIVSGCRLAEVNRLAVFSGKDGTAVELQVTPALINDLLSLSNRQGRLDAYWTHDRLNPENENADALHDSVGVWRNFRTDATGNLIADFQAEPTEYRERILWKAKNDPKGIMCSMVFDYTGDKDTARAVGVSSADFVRFGAATTALLSAYPLQTKTAKLMDISELTALLDDPKVKAAIKAIVKSHVDESAPDEPDADEMGAMADAEKEADVKPEDGKKEDAKLSARMASQMRIHRATVRAMKDQQESTAVLAEARMAKRIGSGDFKIGGNGDKKDVSPVERFHALVKAKLASGAAKDMGHAKMLAAKEDKEGYNAFRAAA